MVDHYLFNGGSGNCDGAFVVIAESFLSLKHGALMILE